ncbi:PREDICTED: uncharacterized protein LOC109218305 isoform X2 [Nicotiana attenuata]|uniref:uncharacterized protein LOC109218305 isoform X2 n=1 Tax=Nicotiana attenuata TaxID=49451 RepID=UPI0009053901|nr:PREDICTED: uncharacterized protein LOC109218305 isoform X2 [Nicotiana attenuata]
MGTAGASYSVQLSHQFHRRPLHLGYLRQPPFLLPVTCLLATSSSHKIIKLYFRRSSGSRRLVNPPRAVLSSQSQGGSGSSEVDPDLRSVLELATDSELYELQRILFGPSYFSPLLKSVAKRDEIDYIMIGEDLEEREEFLSMLESRFLYLAADARSTLRGRRPSYREVLLGVREKLSIRCSAKLSTEDLEAEIFLHLLQEYSSSKESSDDSDGHGNLEFGLSKWKVQAVAAIKAGAEGARSVILKGGGVLTLGRIYNGLARRFSGKMLLEAANYQISKEVLKKGGEVAALNLESRLAMLAAKKGLAGAASRYFGLRSMMTFLGPIIICRHCSIIKELLFFHKESYWNNNPLPSVVGSIADILLPFRSIHYARCVYLDQSVGNTSSRCCHSDAWN